MARPSRLGFFGLFLSLGACGPDTGGGPLDWPATARTALFAVRPDGSRARTYAFFRGEEIAGADSVSLPRGGAAAVVGFLPRLEDLQVPAGRYSFSIEPVQTDCEDQLPRALPEWTLAFRGGDRGWTRSSTLPEDFLGLQLPPLDLGQCYLIGSGGCVGARRRFCRADCAPVPQPMAPEPPRAPQPPRRCPTCDEIDFPQFEICPTSQYFDLRAGTCLPLGRPCPPDIFPEPRAEDPPTVYVSSNAASGGNGSREQPYRTLDEALEGRGPETRVLLGRGTHRAENRELGAVWMEGACVEQTRLEGSIRFAQNATVSEIQLAGQFAVLAGAWLRFRGVELLAADQSGVVRAFGGLDADRFRVDGGVIVDGGEARLSQADIRGMPGLWVENGDVTANGLALSGDGAGSGALLRGSKVSSIRLQHGLLQVARGQGVLLLDRAGLTATDFVLVGTQSASLGLQVEATATASLARGRIQGFTRQGFFVGRNARGFATDLEVIASSEGSLAGVGVLEGSGRFDRVRVRGLMELGFDIGGPTPPVTVRHLETVGPRTGIVARRSTVDLRWLLLREPLEAGMVLSGGATATVADVRVVGPTRLGLTVGEAFEDDVLGSIARVSVDGATSVGFEFNRLGMELSDLAASGGRTGIEVSPGISMPTGISISLERARLVGQEFAFFLESFTPGLGNGLTIRDITIADARTGVAFRSCWPHQATFLSTVRIFNTSIPISFLSGLP